MFFSEMRGDKKKEEDLDTPESKKRRYTEEGRAKARERFSRDERGGGSGGGGSAGSDDHQPPSHPGFGRRPRDDYEDEDADEEMDRRLKSASSRRSTGCKRLLPGVDRLPQRRPRLTSLAS